MNVAVVAGAANFPGSTGENLKNTARFTPATFHLYSILTHMNKLAGRYTLFHHFHFLKLKGDGVSQTITFDKVRGTKHFIEKVGYFLAIVETEGTGNLSADTDNDNRIITDVDGSTRHMHTR